MSNKSKKSTAAGTSQPASSPSDWLAALSAPEINESPGEDWLTRDQVGKLINRKRYVTQQYLANAVKNGTVEVKKFYLPRSDGGMYATPHYRILK